MVGGLILLALGLKHALSATEVSTAGRWGTGSVLALHGGALLYLLGLLAFEKRGFDLVGRSVALGIGLLLAAAPVALNAPALGSLAILAACLGTAVIADRTVFAGRHRRLHEAVAGTVRRVTAVRPHQLFLDLIVVYAFIQITVLVTRQPSPAGWRRASVSWPCSGGPGACTPGWRARRPASAPWCGRRCWRRAR